MENRKWNKNQNVIITFTYRLLNKSTEYGQETGLENIITNQHYVVLTSAKCQHHWQRVGIVSI